MVVVKRRTARVLNCIILIIAFYSCENKMLNKVEYDEQDNIQTQLRLMQSLGVTIDEARENKSVIDFFFSNGTIFSFNKDLVVFKDITRDRMTIDERALVIEDYENWSFISEDHHEIKLGKSLFINNPDEIIRGVNHRGYSYEAPENTLPAYRLSKLKGFRFVETDVQFTKDGVPVLIHDATVNRTSNGEGAVKELIWDEIRSLDFGKWKDHFYSGTKIPSLEEFLGLCREIDLYPYIELKVGTRDQIETVVSMVEDFELSEKTTYISFSSTLLQYVINRVPGASIGLLVSAPLTLNAINKVDDLKTGNNIVFIDSSDYSEEAATLCRNNSIPLEVWTIDSESTILSLPSYITGVTSNKFHAGRVRFKS